MPHLPMRIPSSVHAALPSLRETGRPFSPSIGPHVESFMQLTMIDSRRIFSPLSMEENSAEPWLGLTP